MDSTEIVEADSAENLAAAFASPAGASEMVPYAPQGGGPLDAVVTARKVEVARQTGKIFSEIQAFAAAAGEDWFYRFPVNTKEGKKWIEGPSIKCANNVARLYGNCQIDTRVADMGDTWIIYARFVDLETGFSMTRPFQQRKGQQSLRTKDAGRALDIALQIGVSKAIRNVVCNALETFTTRAMEAAQQNMVDKVGKRLDHYRAKVVARLAEMKIDIKRVEAGLGRASKDWLAPDVTRVIAEIKAVDDGMASAREIWPGADVDGDDGDSRNANLSDPFGDGKEMPATSAGPGESPGPDGGDKIPAQANASGKPTPEPPTIIDGHEVPRIPVPHGPDGPDWKAWAKTIADAIDGAAKDGRSADYIQAMHGEHIADLHRLRAIGANGEKLADALVGKFEAVRKKIEELAAE